MTFQTFVKANWPENMCFFFKLWSASLDFAFIGVCPQL